jgi:hypothetical protein
MSAYQSAHHHAAVFALRVGAANYKASQLTRAAIGFENSPAVIEGVAYSYKIVQA